MFCHSLMFDRHKNKLIVVSDLKKFKNRQTSKKNLIQFEKLKVCLKNRIILEKMISTNLDKIIDEKNYCSPSIFIKSNRSQLIMKVFPSISLSTLMSITMIMMIMMMPKAIFSAPTSNDNSDGSIDQSKTIQENSKVFPFDSSSEPLSLDSPKSISSYPSQSLFYLPFSSYSEEKNLNHHYHQKKLDQPSSTKNERSKRSGISDQRLAELVELARLEMLHKLIRDSSQNDVAYGLIDPAVIGRRRKRYLSKEEIENQMLDESKTSKNKIQQAAKKDDLAEQELDRLVELLVREQQHAKRRRDKALSKFKLNRYKSLPKSSTNRKRTEKSTKFNDPVQRTNWLWPILMENNQESSASDAFEGNASLDRLIKNLIN